MDETIFCKNRKERSHSQGDACSLQDFDISHVFPTKVPPRGGCCFRKQSNGATSSPDGFKPPNAKIAAPCVSAFGNRLTHSSTIQHRSFDHHLSTTGRTFATNAGTQNCIYRSHDTYASILEILTRIC
ncbi:hypothetical protein V1477_009497 [Vespula maculifrons]|uniref:Uncharacterized protein n=1 Tax=Vespula maculifrons TaxID=7453 RepID=A0ABD2C9Y8_VESMC